MVLLSSEKEILASIIIDQMHRYSEFTVQDLYKLFYQASMGNKHLMEDEEKAKEDLESEWRELGKVKSYESLLEVIDPAGLLMRVNLRVYKKTGGQIESLFAIMKTSADQFRINLNMLGCYWNIAGELAGTDQIPLLFSDLTNFWRGIEERGFPEISHSDQYEEIHEPAYRVVMKSLWEGFKSEK